MADEIHAVMAKYGYKTGTLRAAALSRAPVARALAAGAEPRIGARRDGAARCALDDDRVWRWVTLRAGARC